MFFKRADRTDTNLENLTLYDIVSLVIIGEKIKDLVKCCGQLLPEVRKLIPCQTSPTSNNEMSVVSPSRMASDGFLISGPGPGE